jgi:hypothetical protein
MSNNVLLTAEQTELWDMLAGIVVELRTLSGSLDLPMSDEDKLVIVKGMLFLAAQRTDLLNALTRTL